MVDAEPKRTNTDPTPTRGRRTYRASERGDQKRQTRARILKCALTLFSAHGYDATSLREIGEMAGVTHALIRLHFGSKDELWRATIDHLFSNARRVSRQQVILSGVLTREDITGFIEQYVKYCARHPEHVRIMTHEALHDSARLRWLLDRHVKPLHDTLRPLWLRAIADGILPEIPLVSLVYIISSASQMMFALGAEAKHLYGVDVMSEDAVKAHTQAICKLVLRS